MIDQLGPLRVAQISSGRGRRAAALINRRRTSVSIGLLNLFRCRCSTAYHLVFYAAEAVRNNRSDRAQDIGFRIGMALILMLMLVSSWNDIAHPGVAAAQRIRAGTQTRGVRFLPLR